MKSETSTYGLGSIDFDRGKWRLRIWDKRKGRLATVGRYPSEEDAENARTTLHLVSAGTAGRLTLKVFWEIWQKQIQDLPSFRSIKSSWETHILTAPFASLPLSSLTKTEVEEWARSLATAKKTRSVLRNGKRTRKALRENISWQTATHALNYLRNALAFAAKDERYIDHNPADGVGLPASLRKPSDVMAVLSVRDLDRLFAYRDLPLEQRVAFTLELFQGLREGELAGMDWDRIDEDWGGWWIAQSWDKPRTKSGVVRHQVLLQQSQDALKLWWEHRGRPKRGPVFPSPRGYRYSRGYDWGWAHHPGAKGGRGANASVRLTRLGWWHRAGIRTKIRFHDLRDTCATHLLSGTWGYKWTLEEVSKHLGHENVTVTEERYAHLLQDALKRAAAATTQAPKLVPKLVPAGRETDSQNSAQVSEIISGAGNGIRTHDLQHGKLQVIQRSQTLTTVGTSLGQVQTPEAVKLAQQVMQAAAQGRSLTQAELQALAGSVLGEQAVMLAMQVLAGGPHALARGLELAQMLTEAQSANRANPSAGAS